MRRGQRDRRALKTYLGNLADRQRNLTWPDLLRNGRPIDELLFKGKKDAPLVQCIGIVVVAVMYIMVGVLFVDLFATQRSWFDAVFALGLFCAAGFFIRNASRR